MSEPRYTFSTDNGATFAKGAKLPFPALGGNQRPCVHRLLSGNLVFVGDLQVKGSGKQPLNFTPKVGETSGVYAALSMDDVSMGFIEFSAPSLD